ncbi:hypothetical protein [Kocuria rhizophila]|uniref:hypothetical protein n=1 Tax=Kocuria rhizophila TaxID=72000 RepID=UPI00119F461A|nr:hypothetical protein [Kocuria rhizophila]
MSTEQTPMTQERLDAIQERLDVRTSGPWRAIICESEDHPPHGNGVIASGSCWPVVDDETMRVEDADLIANAPQDLKDLLAEVERLRALTTVDDAKIERVARNLANLQVGEAWPTTRELGGVPRSGRDEEYRSAMREWAQKVINISLGEDEDEWI